MFWIEASSKPLNIQISNPFYIFHLLIPIDMVSFILEVSLMSKLNNSRILLAILLLAIFVIFASLSIVLLVQPYFCNLDYVGKYKSSEYGYNRKIKLTIKFEEYGRYIATQTETYNGHRDATYSETGTYEFYRQI